jgi:hypothetical protein
MLVQMDPIALLGEQTLGHLAPPYIYQANT